MNDLKISDKDFNVLRDIMYEVTGVKLSDVKKNLVFSRLRKRLDELELKDFDGYIQRLKLKSSGEMEYFINAITTNETFFFRHEKQFEFIENEVFPKLMDKSPSRGIKIWSAASSTGEEPYTLAITCREFFSKHPSCRYKLFASDINSLVIEHSKKGLYSQRSVSFMKESLRKKYFTEIPSENKFKKPDYQLSNDILKLVHFQQHNLLKSPVYREMDIIFLRNVMIYFDSAVKQKVVDHMENTLKAGGYFFISLSESLFDIKTSLKPVGSGIFQKV